MMRNRAVEFLNEAHGLMEYYTNQQAARQLVRLAIDEVQELLDRLALYEVSDYELERKLRGRIVDAQGMMPAQLSESRRTAIPLQWRHHAALPLDNR